jgi:uncharacterized protein (DUF1697 family)
MDVFVVLLRAIGPLTHKVMSMAQWREASAADGFHDPQTYIATGNMIVGSDSDQEEVTLRMNRIVQSLGLGGINVAVVRRPAQLRQLVKANPFPAAASERGGQVGVHFFAADHPDFTWVADYDGHEKLCVIADHLVVDYGGGLSESVKLPGIIEKRSGVATARNWNTLRALAEKATAREHKDC